MAWAPSTSFEDDLVDLQPNFNLVHGQIAYEANRKREFTPRPKSTYEYLANRERRNEEVEKLHGSKSKEIRASLAMMERIQEIAGTKPLGEHAAMSDWDDTSTVEKEAVAMMRHFGMMSMTDGSLAPPRSDPMPQGNIHVMRNGRRSFPLILDPTFFEPGKTRKLCKPSEESTSSSASYYSYSYSYLQVKETESSDSVYVTANSHLNDTESSQDDHGYTEIPYKLLEETSFESNLPKSPQKRNRAKKQFVKRPSQSQRREIAGRSKR